MNKYEYTMTAMYNLEELFAVIEAHHAYQLCEDADAIDAYAVEHNYYFPDDMRTFYKRYQMVRLFPYKYGAMYRFVSIEEIHPTRMDVWGEDTDLDGPDHWLSVCDVMEGNYVAIDVESVEGNTANYIDCFHETFATPGECKIVAKSFTELLARALASTDNLYYLQSDFIGYGDGRPLTPENAAFRCENPIPTRSGWMVRFYYNERGYQRYFSDGAYGDADAGFEAVKRFIHKVQNSKDKPVIPSHSSASESEAL